MGKFGKWLEEKDPVALHELAPMGGEGEEDPVEPKSGVKLSVKMQTYLDRLLKAMTSQRLSKKKQIDVLQQVLDGLQGGGMTNTTALATTRAAAV